MASHNPSDLSRHTIAELIQGGDWAGSEGYEGTLASIAHQIAARVGPEQVPRFHEVARLCATDMGAATALWALATAPVRAHRS